MTDRHEASVEDLIERVEREKRAVDDEGRDAAVTAQHEQGKLTARERIDFLCDSFDEIGKLAAPAPTTPETADWEREDAPADGIVTGIGEIDGRPAAVAATDFTVEGGSIGHTGGNKLKRVLDLALEQGYPVVLLHDGGGHRIQEGLDARPFAQGDAGLTTLQTKLSGWVPTVSAMMGPGFAAATNWAAMSDFVVMVEGTSTMGVAGPSLVEAALGTDLSKEELGDARFQTAETGMASLAVADDEACLDAIRTYLSYLPRNAQAAPPIDDDPTPPTAQAVDRLVDAMPADPKKGYDVDAIVEGLVDRNSFFELRPQFARNVVTGFARLDGRSVGVIANNPRIKAGTIDTGASDKASHFASVCDAFGLPIVLLADVPGILPGPDSEREGIARHSAKLPFELNRATVPTLNVVLRRGYGYGYVAMGGGRSTDNDLTVVWPTAEIAAMGIEGAVDVAYREVYEAAADPAAKREELVQEFVDRTGPVRAVEAVGVDAVIDPRDTRDRLLRALARDGPEREESWPPKKHPINPM
ncbi:acyl-CoA carboxylase subunit beta [Halosolutus halophilus]|uniref:acyl-CoA carboxylase subunit beta n=1 Tax=Halosolutus halophilus TaxID=1552990 RepID=UPI00223508DF|nr:carboxyl transferase domain-containing protein [Halosolutus halophilus]